MIVVDTNVIAYLILAGTHTVKARNAFHRDPDWVAPVLWRSEFCNVLAQYMHKDQMSIGQALEFMDEAETLIQGREYKVSYQRVLGLTADSRCSAHDCEFLVFHPTLLTGEQPPYPLLASSSPPLGVILSDIPFGQTAAKLSECLLLQTVERAPTQAEPRPCYSRPVAHNRGAFFRSETVACPLCL